MAVELKDRMGVWLFLASVLAFLAVVAIFVGKGQPQIVVQVPYQQVQPTQVPTTPTTTVEYVDKATVAIYVMDAEANPITNGYAQIWRVYNESNVTGRAFYADSGYSVWLNSSLDELGSATFTITRTQYDVLKQLIQQGKLSLYAVFVPGEGADYYREGVKLPEISFVKGKETTTVTITAKAIAKYYRLNNVALDLMGAKANTEKSVTYDILKVSENENGIFRIYKFVVTPVELENVKDQFKELKLSFNGTEVVLISNGEVKLNESKEVIIPLRELRANNVITVSIYYKLASDANPAYDGRTLVKIRIIDVRGVSLGEVSVTLDTA